jgi:hypothetical protein
LAGDFDQYNRLYQQLDREAARTTYIALIDAAFFEAVDRRFAKAGTVADVIEFVADIRARSERLSEIDSRAAERLIRAALGDGSADDIDDKTRFGAEIVLLAGLIVDERLDDAGLDKFLAEARKLADSWTA